MDQPRPPLEPSLAHLLESIWTRLLLACRQPDAGWRLPALATLGPAGAPRVRTVVLRTVDCGQASITLHTDARSAKATEILRDPRVALLFWDAIDRVQLRAEGEASVEADPAVFATLSDAAMALYAVAPAPGTPIAAPDAMGRTDPAPNFRRLRVQLRALEWLDVAAMHRRAHFDLAAGKAAWLVP
jgi:pyridoxamine 5'-phosphate oxidase